MQSRQVGLRRAQYLLLLATAYTGSRSPKGRRSTQSDLDEHQHITLAHDEIYLAISRTEIAANGNQALSLEKALCLRFRLRPAV